MLSQEKEAIQNLNAMLFNILKHDFTRKLFNVFGLYKSKIKIFLNLHKIKNREIKVIF